jgi:RimJ/RimL family protein N-acetyltransferase
MHFEHYSIRLLSDKDLNGFFNLIEENRSRLEAFFSGTVSRTSTFADTKIYLSEMINKSEHKTYLPFIIVDNITGSFVGFLDIKNIDWNIPKGELGCFIDKKYEGKRISAKAFSLFTNHCFTEFGFNKLFLRTHEKNLAARRLAEGCGFEIEGTIRRDYKTTEGELVDLLYYGKLPGV